MKFPIPQAVDEGYVLMESGGVCDLSYPQSMTRRGRVQGGGKICPTITATNAGLVRLTIYQVSSKMKMTTFKVGDKTCVALVRKLTQRECGRLMGVRDEDITKIEESGASKSSQYKLYGNSIVVDPLKHIFRKLLIEKGNESKQLTIFDAL